jgi:hypothetical protein
MLLRWLQARFPSHPIPEETAKAVKGDALWESHRRLTDVFINLARSQHQQGVMEPDVQVGLGILFYADKEYDRAKDCFETALTAKPKVYPSRALLDLSDVPVRSSRIHCYGTGWAPLYQMVVDLKRR